MYWTGKGGIGLGVADCKEKMTCGLYRDQEAWRCVSKRDMQQFHEGLNQAALAFLRDSEEEWEMPIVDVRLPGEDIEHVAVRLMII